jgi:hypothetical protein
MPPRAVIGRAKCDAQTASIAGNQQLSLLDLGTLFRR